MEPLQPEGLLALTVIVVISLAAVIYVFLRMAGVLGGKARHRGRPPPRSMGG